MEKKENLSVFDLLSSVDVNGHTEQKNGLTYLSWAWAWAEVKKAFPDATYTVYERETAEWGPVAYFTDGRTCWVKTGVTINGLEHIEMLPIMDFKNRSIALEDVTSMDINKAIQRSLTKACARHGLGLYIYAGEDLPEDSKARVAELVQAVDAELRRVSAGMTREQKVAFANDVIKGTIGEVNYKACKDAGKLEALLNKLKSAA